MNNEVKQCQNCKNQFTIESEDFNFYKKIDVPPPTWCPECRMIRRMAWAGYRHLYKRKCDFTGDLVITTMHPDEPFKMYRQDVWWSDKWNAKDYGREYDFKRTLFEQWGELLRTVPFPSLYSEYPTMVNSDYCNAAGYLKNCYLCFRADYSENCAYLNTISRMKDCLDTSFSNDCEISYSSVTINKCYQTFYSQDCEECHDVYFSKDLVGCSNCFGCINLRNKKYYIFNKPYSKEEYEKELRSFDLGSKKRVVELQKEIDELLAKFPHKEFHGRKIVNSSGDYLLNCKNVRNSFMVQNSEDLRYCQLLKSGPSAQAYDYTMFALRAEWIYESCWVGLDVNNIKFGLWDYGAHDLEFCFGCHGSGNLFGCVGVRNSEYCIFNKQYSKEQYKELVTKIKEQIATMPYKDNFGREYSYGEYLPIEFCPWAYNESTAYEWFPLTKEEAMKGGFKWRDPDEREYQNATTSVPDHIKDVSESILNEVLKCEECGRNHKLIKMEFDFYKRFQVPIPTKCPLCRDYDRIKQLNPMKLHDRSCAKCGKDILTSYASERPEIVYCEECYNAEVV